MISYVVAGSLAAGPGAVKGNGTTLGKWAFWVIVAVVVMIAVVRLMRRNR